MQQRPENHKKRVKSYMKEVDEMLVHFIDGRFIIALISSILLLIGFLIIGIPYPFILALFSLIFYIIPTVGAFLSMIIPILVGFSMGITMGIETTCLVVFVAGLEGMIISNLVMGKTLFIHPLTSIIVLIIGGIMGGIIGLLFSIPAYVLIKITYDHLYRYHDEVSQA
jgi:predicted PurR-regulated permease PerM